MLSRSSISSLPDDGRRTRWSGSSFVQGTTWGRATGGSSRSARSTYSGTNRLLTLRCRRVLEVLPGAPVTPVLPTVMLVAAHEVTCAGGRATNLSPISARSGGLRSVKPMCPVHRGARVRGTPGGNPPRRDEDDRGPPLHAGFRRPRNGWRGSVPKRPRPCAPLPNGNPPVSIRANALKGGVGECREALAKEGIDAVPGTLSPVALVFRSGSTLKGSAHSARVSLRCRMRGARFSPCCWKCVRA